MERLLLLLTLLRLSSGQTCPRDSGEPACVCKTDNGIIDLTYIANKDDRPKFTGVSDSLSLTYSYNPCYGFSLKGDGGCSKGTAVCQIDVGGGQRSCGESSTEEMYSDGHNWFIQYIGGREGRASIIKLICSERATTPVLKFTSESSLTYNFELTSRCACFNGCPYSEGGSKAGVVGILLMVFPTMGVATYFVVGALIMKFKYQKTGTDIIPQKQYWLTFLSLIKEGCMFTVSQIKVLFTKVTRKNKEYDEL